MTRQYHQNILGRPGNITKHKLGQPGNIIRNKHSDSASNSLKQISQKCPRFSLIAYLVGVILNRQSTVLWVQTVLFLTSSCFIIRIWGRVSDKKQILLIFREYQSSSPVFLKGSMLLIFLVFFVLSYYVSLRSKFHIVKSSSSSSSRKECTQV